MKKLITFLTLFLLALSSYAAETLVTSTTSATQSSAFTVPEASEQTIIVYDRDDLGAAEYVDVQISHDGCTTFDDLYYGESQVRLSDGQNAVTIYGPGCFRVDKDATSSAVGVYRSYAGSL